MGLYDYLKSRCLKKKLYFENKLWWSHVMHIKL